MPGRTIAIGDIHGCADALHALLREIQPQADDTIITLGDYVDRGHQSAQVFEILIELVTRCHLVPLLGNHEIMMAAAFNSRSDYDFWLQCGGKATLQSYGGNMRQIPAHHRTFLHHCRRYFETDSHFFVHAGYEPFVELEHQQDEVLFWQHIEQNVPEPHFSNKVAIVGHTPQESGEIRDLGHLKIIDTFCYGDQWLTAFDVESGQIWQARTDGALRDPSANGSPIKRMTPVNDLDQTDQSADNWITRSSLELTGAQFKESLKTVGDYIAEFIDDLPNAPVFPDEVGQRDLEEIAEPVPEDSTALNELLGRLFGRYIHNSFNTASPGYLAYIPGGGFPEAAISDLIAQITNRFITVWTATPQLAQIESTVVRWFCEIVGYREGSGGYLSSGGSTANQTAIVTARTTKLDNNRTDLGDYSKATLYVSDQGHHCLRKSAFLAGIPRDNFRVVPSNHQQKIDIEMLRQLIQLDIDTGYRPFLIVGSAGTTNTGAVDDLSAMRKVADDYDCWFHVDAAYGGFFCMTERGRELLAGIETADSIVLDPHKGMFMPYGTGSLLVKNLDHLRQTHSFTSDYMPDMTDDPDRIDFCEISPELSRGNRSLRLWLPIKQHGIGVFRELLEEKLDLITWLHQELQDFEKQQNGRFEIVTPPELSVLSFRVNSKSLPLESVNRMNQRLIDEINSSGRIMVTGTMLDGKFIVRICILSFRTHFERIKETLEIVKDACKFVSASTVS